MRYILLPAFLFIFILASGQERPKYKFGSVSPDEFKKTVYSVDSNATAVVLADIGSTEIIGNNKGSFSLLFKRYFRAHILNKSGYDISTISIPLYASGDREENIDNLKAVTYNLENGKVISTKLDVKGNVFRDVISKNLVVKKFTLPNVKEGSIIEVEYKIESDFIHNLQGWEFQGSYPVLWSEYNVANPSFFTYMSLKQGYHPLIINEQKYSQGSFQMADIRGTGATERISFNSEVVNYRWAMRNVPALKAESYTSSVKNHIAKIQFQMSSIGYPFEPKQIMSTWPAVTKSMIEDEEFGGQLGKDNGFLNDVISEAANGATSPLEKARQIFNWVRDHFTCTDDDRLYMDASLKNILKNRNGSEAEINLLLTALLRKAGMDATPVILSRRSNGFAHPIYPIMERFNYVISRLVLDGKTYFLDASEPILGFGRLNYQCYNGHARIINEEATPLNLNAESLKEESLTSVFIMNDEKGNSVGSFRQTPGYDESSDIREEIREKGIEAYREKIAKKHGSEFIVRNITVDSLKKYDDPLSISYEIDLAGEKEDIIYFNPMFGEGFKENPFKSAQRLYPVELPFSMDETFNLQMEVPAGYELDELPKQAVVKFNENNDAYFEYRVSVSNNMISLRSRLTFKKVFFQAEDYETLREFFNLVVMKHNEQIVFKKKK